MKKLLILFFAMALLIGGYIYIIQRSYLITTGIVPVYKTADDAMKSPAPQPIFMLPSGQRVRVVDIVDVKHYQIYMIHAPDGQQGYVLEGEYRLEH